MKRFLMMVLALTMLLAGCSTEVTEYRQQQRGAGEGTKGLLTDPDKNKKCYGPNKTAPEDHFRDGQTGE